MKIKKISSTDEKIEICKSIVDSLPDWFDEKGRSEYVLGVGDTNVWASYDSDKLIGFISIKKNNEFTSEVYVFGVLKEYQRSGVGSKLLEIVCNDLAKNNVKLLAVKTLDSSADFEPYDRIRNFYLKQGFMPVDVYKKIWNEENPCLVMVKII